MNMLENSIAPQSLDEMGGASEELDESSGTDMLAQVLAAIKGQSPDSPMINIFILPDKKEETQEETYIGGALPLPDGSLNFGGM